MLKRYHNIVGGFFRLFDAFIIGCAWLISYWARFYLPIIEVKKGFPLFSQYAALTPLIVFLWVLVFSVMKVYQSRRMPRRTHEVIQILKAHGVAILFFITLTFMFTEYRYSRGVMLYFGILGGVLLVFFRLSLRNTLRALRKKGFNLRHCLAVGEGGSIETIIHRLNKFPELGINVKGVVVHQNSSLKSIQGKPVLGRYEQIADIAEQNEIDQIIISLPQKDYLYLNSILNSIRDLTVDIQVVPDVHEYVTLGCEVEDFDGMPIVNINESPLDGWGAIAKRMTDFILSLIALIFLLPVFLLLAVLVKVTSKGPIFYKQVRMGLDGKPFNMYKFRSMKIDAENQSGAVWAQKNDNRKTAFGSFLRATSLDEIPQFWNVLKGEMSLVGPRPERPVFVKQFREEIPNYMLRHKVKAGITGWAQVNGWRGNTSLNKRIECDLYYIRNWSYFFDLKILILTLFKGFIHKNAY